MAQAEVESVDDAWADGAGATFFSVDDLNPVVLSRVPLGNFASVIVASVVDDDPQSGPDRLIDEALESFFNVLSFVLGRSDDENASAGAGFGHWFAFSVSAERGI